MKILLTILLFCFATALSAATYCVGPSATGSGSGADWSNVKAWTNAPVRGDTWYLMDGTYAGRTFSTANSGTSAITINKAIDSDHVTNTGWNLGTMGSSHASIGHLDMLSSYWVLDGQVGSGFGIIPPDITPSNYGIWLADDSAAITVPAVPPVTVTDLRFSHVYSSTDTNDFAKAGAGHVFGISDTGPSGYGTRVDNLTIDHSLVIGWGQALCVDGATVWTNVLWDHNVYLLMLRTSAQHGNPINVRYSDTYNMVIRNSLFAYSYGEAGVGLSEVISYNQHNPWPNQMLNTRVYGCVFDQGWSGDAVIDSNDSMINGTWVYNNTFLLSWAGGGNRTSDPGGGLFGVRSGTNNFAYNNLAYNCSGLFQGSGDITRDYNEFVYTAQTPSLAAHDVSVSTDQNPFINNSARNYTLTTNTSAGMNLGSPYNVDALGHTRTTWTRGAFEFSSGSVIVPPPQVPRRLIIMTAQ